MLCCLLPLALVTALLLVIQLIVHSFNKEKKAMAIVLNDLIASIAKLEGDVKSGIAQQNAVIADLNARITALEANNAASPDDLAALKASVDAIDGDVVAAENPQP